MAEGSAVEQKQVNSLVRVEKQVEWIEREMKAIYASLELVEALERFEYNKGVKAWVEEAVDVAREADLLDNIVHGSAQKQRRGILKRSVSVISDLKDRYRRGKALQRLKDKFRNITERDIFRWPKFFGPFGYSTASEDAVSSAANDLYDVLERFRSLGASIIVGEQTNERSSCYFAADKAFARIVMQPSAKDLAKQVEWTQRGLEEMHAFLQYVQRNGREVDDRVQDWVTQIRNAVHDINDLADQTKIGIFRRTGRKIKRIKIQIFTICRNISTYDNEGLRAIRDDSSIFENLHQTGPSIPAEGDVDFVIGREKDKHIVMQQLLTGDERRGVISVVGMRGIGKTTLARMVYHDVYIKDRFPRRAWVTVSEDSDTIGLLQDIGGQLMGSREIKGKWNEEQEAMKNLHAFLSDREDKRYLVVLDRIWKIETWDSLQATFPDTSNGSRILLTTRLRDVALPTDSGSLVYKMPLLPKEDSWHLFKYTLKEDIYLEVIGREIVERCRGLPLAIVTTGRFLFHQKGNIRIWRYVLEVLREDNSPWLENLYEMNEDLLWNLRRCLFYFGLFSADFKIPCRRLIVLWVAEGLVHQKEKGDERETLEDVAERYLTELVYRNVVEVTERKITGEVKTCRLPDTLRGQILSKAKKARFLQGQTQTITTACTSKSSPADHTGVVNIPRLADHFDEREPSFEHIHGRNNTNPPAYDCYRDLLSFLSFDHRAGSKPGEEIGNFLDRCISRRRCFRKLRVLDLEHVFRPKLPKTLGKLIRLRYLGLRWTYLEKLPPFVSKLLNLRTLDLKHTYISTLPRSIWEMEYLRHLYLSETHRSRFDRRPRRCYLTHLQTLWGVCVDEESQVKDGLDTMRKIRKLGVACRLELMSSKLDEVAEWIKNLKDQLETLRLKSYDKLGQPWDLHLPTLSGHSYLSSLYLLGRLKNPSVVKEFPPNLVELTLSATGLQDDPMETLGKLSNLRILRLFHESFVTVEMNCKSGSFPQLRVLKLWKLEQLKEWYAEEGALPKLTDLEIRSCRDLKELPIPLQFIRSLKELKFSNMPKEFTDQIMKYKCQEEQNRTLFDQMIYIDDVLM